MNRNFEEDNMKILKMAALGIIFASVLFWFSSIAVCEYNTYKYGEVFRNIKIHDIGGEGYLKDEKVKILKCGGCLYI